MKILLTGKNGQIGWELQRTLMTLGDIVAFDSKTLDLANPDAICSTVRAIKPQLIINAAAYTAVDKAEDEPELAMAINGVAPGILAEEAKRLNAAIVHYSTDYVFDGKGAKEPYLETDQPNPLNVYGKTKLAGDQAIQAIGVSHLILRTGWVYGTRGKNFLLTILKLARERKEIKVVNDQIGAPTWSRTIAEVTAQALVKIGLPVTPPSSRLNEVSGLYNLASSDQTSWHGFAKAIVAHLKSNPSLLLIPIPASEYPLPAKQPAFSKLNCGKIERAFGLSMPSWERSLALAQEEMMERLETRQ
jgi:dTDP-4-dehydrorhamnose reductase